MYQERGDDEGRRTNDGLTLAEAGIRGTYCMHKHVTCPPWSKRCREESTGWWEHVKKTCARERASERLPVRRSGGCRAGVPKSLGARLLFCVGEVETMQRRVVVVLACCSGSRRRLLQISVAFLPDARVVQCGSRARRRQEARTCDR